VKFQTSILVVKIRKTHQYTTITMLIMVPMVTSFNISKSHWYISSQLRLYIYSIWFPT